MGVFIFGGTIFPVTDDSKEISESFVACFKEHFAKEGYELASINGKTYIRKKRKNIEPSVN